MKTAQLTSNQQFTIKEIPKPIPKNEEVLVNIKTMSICGSDLRSYIKSDKHLKTPGFPCHECTGIVIQSQTTDILAENFAKFIDIYNLESTVQTLITVA